MHSSFDSFFKNNMQKQQYFPNLGLFEANFTFELVTINSATFTFELVTLNSVTFAVELMTHNSATFTF